MRRRVPLSGALVLWLCCAPAWAARAEESPRQSTLDAIHYGVHLDLPATGEEIKAETEILLAFNEDGVREVALDFAGLTVDAVTENGSPCRYVQQDGQLRLTLGGSYRRGARVLVAVTYHGRPSDGLFIKRNKFGDRTIFADNWPNRAHYWFPSIDHPADKATVEFFINAPARYDVVANGSLVETTTRADGTRFTHWSETVPIPVYCMVVGATEFSVLHEGAWNGTALSYYLYPRDREHGLRDYGRALQMLDFYTNLIGPFPYEKLALVQSSTRFGGMENASSIFFDEGAFDGSGRLEDTVAHEIAHQWFGDSVTESDWHHLWLSEGFATYFGHLFFERAEGRDRFLALMRADERRYLAAAEETARPVYDPAVTDLFKLLNRNNYQKGGWVLHMLRHLLGDERFFAGIRDYYRTFRDRNALTEDFQRVMERQAGRPLDWFFHEWIYEPGYPALDAAWHWDAARREVRLRVRQTQAGTLFRMPLDVELRTGDAARREVVQLDAREQTYTFAAEARPSAVALDPDEWLLKVLTLREE